jgi:hypothetical protein
MDYRSLSGRELLDAAKQVYEDNPELVIPLEGWIKSLEMIE